MEKELLIDAICGTYPPIYSSIIRHLVEYTGDQWNENWEWKREELEKLSCAELEALYRQVKDKGSELYNNDPIVTTSPASVAAAWSSSKTADEILADLEHVMNITSDKYIAR